VSVPVDWLPESVLDPDHAPEAEQEVVSVVDQVSVEAPPLATDVGFAASNTVGLVKLRMILLVLTSEPQPPKARASAGTNNSVFMRNMGSSFHPSSRRCPKLNQVSCNRHSPLHLLGGSFSRSILHFRPRHLGKIPSGEGARSVRGFCGVR
jgi:hypothetical protein